MKEVSRSEDRDQRSADRGRVRLLQGDVMAPCGPPASEAGGPRYLLRPSVEPLVDRQGALCFVRPGEQDLLVRDPAAADVALVTQLRAASATAAALAAAIGVDVEAVQEKLDSLVASGVVLVRDAAAAEPLAGGDGERFSRQLPYLSELGDAVALQRRLRDAAVT